MVAPQIGLGYHVGVDGINLGLDRHGRHRRLCRDLRFAAD